jgi:hypothetical protein
MTILVEWHIFTSVVGWSKLGIKNHIFGFTCVTDCQRNNLALQVNALAMHQHRMFHLSKYVSLQAQKIFYSYLNLLAH